MREGLEAGVAVEVIGGPAARAVTGSAAESPARPRSRVGCALGLHRPGDTEPA